MQEEFAYIPDDGSATYVINVQVINRVFKASNWFADDRLCSRTQRSNLRRQKWIWCPVLCRHHLSCAVGFARKSVLPSIQPEQHRFKPGVNWKSIANIPSEPSDSTSTASGSQSAASPKNTQNNNGGTAGAASPSTTGTPASSGAEAAFSAKFAMTALLAVLSFAGDGWISVLRPRSTL